MANNYFRGTISANTNVAGNWSLGVVPTQADGHVAVWDNLSPNCTVNAALNCNSVNFSSYTGILALNYVITSYGNITLGGAFTITGTSYLFIGVTGITITSNGGVWSGGFGAGSSRTVTLVGNLSVGTIATNGGTLTFNKTTNEKVILTNGVTTGGAGFFADGTIESIELNNGTFNKASYNVPVILNGATSIDSMTVLKGISYVSGSGSIGTYCYITNGYSVGLGSYTAQNIVFTGAGTTTLTTDINLTKLLTFSNTTDNITINGYSINCGSLNSNLTTGTLTGTTVINLNGLGVEVSRTGISNTINTLTPTENIFTGATANWNTATNWSQGTVPTATDGYLTRFNASSPNCTVNASSMAVNAISFSGYTNTITMTNGLGLYGNILLGSGMSISGSGAITINSSGLLTGNGKTWSTSITFSSNLGVNVLSGDWTNSGLCTITSGNTISINKTSTEKLILSGGLTHTGTTTNTAQIQMTGGTWSGSGVLNGDLDFNGNCTVNAAVNKGTGAITRTSGTITTTGSTITFNNNNTITVSGVTWNNISFSTSPLTITLDQDLTINGTMTLAASHTFSGSYNMSIPTFTLSGTGRTINLSGGLSITTAFNSTGSTSASHNVIKSSSAGTKRALTLSGTHDLSFVDFTDINASSGIPIWTYKGTVSNCDNVLQLNANSFVESQIIAA